MLTDPQRAELEKHGAPSVRLKLLQSGAGRGAAVSGFNSGLMTRDEIEDWLAEKHREETELQQGTLRWAKIAAWAGIASVIATVIAAVLAMMLQK